MIDLDAPAPRRRLEPVLPMINLVFLLLIFFLISAVIAPRPPVPVEPPRAERPRPLAPDSLRAGIDADGRLAFGPVRGPTALAAIAEEVRGAPEVTVALHADRRAPAAAVAGALGDLAEIGVGEVWMVTERQR